MLRSCVAAALVGVVCSSGAMAQDRAAESGAQDRVEQDKLTQAVQGMFGSAAQVTVLGRAAASTPINDVIYFSISGPDGRAAGWYIANCAKLLDGGWVCPVAPIGQAFILKP
jgi:hypothetical protein